MACSTRATRWPPPTTAPTCCSTSCAAACSSTARAFDRDDLLAFVHLRASRAGRGAGRAGGRLAGIGRARHSRWTRRARRSARRANGWCCEYLPLTFSRRHGDPSRPWNRFSIRVRDAAGRRVVDYQGNWRDIFQNWEALVASQPEYLGSMIATFLGAMTPDGYNPYRIGRDGIDWEVPEPENPWSQIGYWGDHQIVYLLRLLEAAQAHDPALLARLVGPRAVQLCRRALPAEAPRRTGGEPEVDDRLRRTRRTGAPTSARSGWVPTVCCLCDEAGLPRAGHAGREAGHHPAGQGRQPGARRRPVAAHAAAGVERRQQCAGRQRPVGGDAGPPAPAAGLPAGAARRHMRPFERVGGDTAGAAGFQRPWCAPRRWPRWTTPRRGDASWTTPARCSTAGVVPPTRARRPRARRRAGGTAAALAQVLLPLVDATLAASRRGDGLFDSYNLVDLSRRPRRSRARCTRCSKARWRCCPAAGCRWPTPWRCSTRCSRARCTCPHRRTFLLYPDRACPASWSATGSTTRPWRCPSRNSCCGRPQRPAAGAERRHGALRARTGQPR